MWSASTTALCRPGLPEASEHLLRLPRREGEVLYGSYSPLECDYNPRMVQEVEGGAVSPPNAHEVYPRTSQPHQRGCVIEAADLDVLQRHLPGEEAEPEHQTLRGQTDDERSVVDGVEEEEDGEADEDDGESIKTNGAEAPDEQQDKERSKRQKERLRRLRRDPLLIDQIVSHRRACRSG